MAYPFELSSAEGLWEIGDDSGDQEGKYVFDPGDVKGLTRFNHPKKP